MDTNDRCWAAFKDFSKRHGLSVETDGAHIRWDFFKLLYAETYGEEVGPDPEPEPTGPLKVVELYRTNHRHPEEYLRAMADCVRDGGFGDVESVAVILDAGLIHVMGGGSKRDLLGLLVMAQAIIGEEVVTDQFDRQLAKDEGRDHP